MGRMFFAPTKKALVVAVRKCDFICTGSTPFKRCWKGHKRGAGGGKAKGGKGRKSSGVPIKQTKDAEDH